MCSRTWRIRKKKTGRKRKRANPSHIVRFLDKQTLSTYVQAQVTSLSQRSLQNRLRRSRAVFLRQVKWPAIPEQPILILADALMIAVESTIYTCYIILIRPVAGSTAIITCPYWQAGKESAQGWYVAFNHIPENVKSRVKALVCDGHTGLLSMAKKRGWLIQRCHFHLLAALQGRRSRRIQSRHQALGQFMYEHAKNILNNPSEQNIGESLRHIKMIKENTGSQVLRKVLSGFHRYYQDYRTYVSHPELHLPTTTNAVESLNSNIRDLLYRIRGVRTFSSLQEWVEALLKHRQKVTCNGWLPTKFQ